MSLGVSPCDASTMADQALTVRDSGSGDGGRSSPVVRTGSESGFGIYKYGRGYWVRVLTAIAFGMLFLAGAGWAWKNLATVSLPAKAYILQVAQSQNGELAQGEAVTLYNVIDGKDVKVGAGTVEKIERAVGAASTTLTVGTFVAEADATARDAKVVANAAGARAALQRENNAITKIPVFSPVYLQAGIAGLMLLTGMGLIYNYVGRKPSSVDFLIATDEEMRKVNWSTKKTIFDSTIVVIFATFVIAGFIFFWDTVLKKALMDWIVSW